MKTTTKDKGNKSEEIIDALLTLGFKKKELKSIKWVLTEKFGEKSLDKLIRLAVYSSTKELSQEIIEEANSKMK